MREIEVSVVIKVVRDLCIKANCYLPSDVKQVIEVASQAEESPIGRNIFNQIIENAYIAADKKVAICQDTGMVVVFCEVGQDVHFTGGNITDAINEGVRQGYKEGYFRNSVVRDPLDRKNTGDNTPAIVYYDIVPGDRVEISLMPKGFGSENMSGLKMLKPSDGVEGVINFIIETVERAGPNPCPPIIVGVGIGGTMEKAALLAKKALLRPINVDNPREDLNRLEKEILERINKLGIGPGGLGGRITALKVNVETFATHIAGLPVAVNISCHAARHSKAVI